MSANGEETNGQAFDHAFADVLESVSGDPDVFLTAAFSFLMRRSTLSADVLGDGDCAKQAILDKTIDIFGSQVDLRRKNMEGEFLKPIDTGMTMHQYDSALQDDVDEFLLIKTPPNLKVLTDLLEEGSNSSSRRRCIWLKPGYSYISSSDATDPEIYGYAGLDFWFTCRASPKSSRIDLRRFKIHASSEKEREDNLALIATIPDTYFERVALIASTDGYTRCPLKEKDLLDFVSSNEDRWTEFRRVSFSCASSHVLAGDKVQKIAFNDCDFYEDGGALFVDTLSAQQRTGRELSKSFRFEKSIPFDGNLWSQFLGLLTEVCELQLVNFNSDLYTTPAPKVDVLVIHNCSFRDDGDALIENIAKDNGPKRLRLFFSSELYQIGSELVFFETESRFCRLMAALSRNARLTELSLEGMILREGCLQGLASALRSNNSLEKLRIVHGVEVGSKSFATFLSSLSSPAHLVDVDIQLQSGVSLFLKRGIIKTVENVLTLNDQIEYFKLRPDFEETRDWKKTVKPRLHFNRFMKILLSFENSRKCTYYVPSLSHVMSKASANPSLMWHVLKTNQGILSSREFRTNLSADYCLLNIR